jgi:cell division protein FtsN
MGLPSQQVEQDISPVLFSKYQTPSLKTPTNLTDNNSTLKTPVMSSSLPPLQGEIALATPHTITPGSSLKQYVQVGTFSVKSNAEKIQQNLQNIGDVALNQVKVGEKSLYRVQIGPLKDKEEAKAALEKTISSGHPNALLVMN